MEEGQNTQLSEAAETRGISARRGSDGVLLDKMGRSVSQDDWSSSNEVNRVFDNTVVIKTEAEVVDSRTAIVTLSGGGDGGRTSDKSIAGAGNETELEYISRRVQVVGGINGGDGGVGSVISRAGPGRTRSAQERNKRSPQAGHVAVKLFLGLVTVNLTLRKSWTHFFFICAH